MERLGTIVLILAAIALGLFIRGQAAQLMGGAAPTPVPQQVVLQNPPPQQVVQAPAQQPVVQQPQTASANPPTQEVIQDPPAGPGQGGDFASWICPGEELGNKCMLTGSADLVAGLCIDYDFRSTSIAGPHEEVDTNVAGTSKRAKITGPAAYVGQYPATVYKDPGCGPYPEGF